MSAYPRRVIVTMAVLLLMAGTAAAQGVFDDPEKLRVVDRVVICFDEASVLREISAWNEEEFWPVLLWESDLVPKFVEAFGPKEVLLAKYAKKDDVSVDAALRAVASAWGADPAEVAAEPKRFLAVLESRKRAPMGVVLLTQGSPELLGGVALAAGRFHLPLVYTTPEKHAKRVSFERKDEIRGEIASTLSGLGIDFAAKFDDLDFVTVANDMPFGYTQSDPDAHPGGYTIDDAVARNDDRTRWGWIGRLIGGPERSVYVAMGALLPPAEEGAVLEPVQPEQCRVRPV